MTRGELENKWKVYTECWKFFRDFSAPVDDDSFWEGLVKAKDELQAKIDCPLFRGVMLATVQEIERVWKAGKRKQKDEINKQTKGVVL
ncbi:hypothetical protein NXH76_17365 [Blautia schinkii]|nr:hypothetical protein [Blautia schinkii]